MLILLNSCYGGFDIAYKYSIHASIGYTIPNKYRTDPVILALFMKYGPEIGTKHSEIYMEFIPDKYSEFYRIHEYDGQENIIIDYAKYKVQKIKKLAEESDCISADAILRITDETDLYDSDIHDEEYNRCVA